MREREGKFLAGIADPLQLRPLIATFDSALESDIDRPFLWLDTAIVVEGAERPNLIHKYFLLCACWPDWKRMHVM